LATRRLSLSIRRNESSDRRDVERRQRSRRRHSRPQIEGGRLRALRHADDEARRRRPRCRRNARGVVQRPRRQHSQPRQSLVGPQTRKSAMIDAVALPLSNWESFYVIVGSSGAALTGLQFVVIALIADSQRRASFAEINAFGTPTVVHFCSALLISALLSAPWRSLYPVGWLLGVAGLAGVGYVALVTRRARMQTGYRPVFEDWLWHVVLPLAAYFAFTLAGVFLT